MASKRRRSSIEYDADQRKAKKVRSRDPLDLLSDLSDELLIRIFHNLPIHTLLQCQRLSHRFYTLAGDSQIWKNLYYNRFVLPRALRIPGIRTAQTDDALSFSSRRSRWLEDDTLVNRADGQKTNWKKQYKLRYNWSIGACAVQEIQVATQSAAPAMLVQLAERIVVTADKDLGLRAWELKGKSMVASCKLQKGSVPTCLAINEQDTQLTIIEMALGFEDGSWGIWILDVAAKSFHQKYKHPPSSNGTLSAVAYAKPYVLSITDGQLLSLYTFGPKPVVPEPELSEDEDTEVLNKTVRVGSVTRTSQHDIIEIESGKPIIPDSGEYQERQLFTASQPHLLASLKSHTSWPPLSLSIRATASTLVASVAYSLPTFLSGYTIALQELHISLETLNITLSRLTSALPNGFHSIISTPSTPNSPSSQTEAPPNINNSPPTSLSYSHPYILASYPDNTLTLYLCTSTTKNLSLTPGTKLWGHTSSISGASITPRGKAVSVSTRGHEMRVWSLEGGSSRKRSVQVVQPMSVGEEKRRWVGFDDEVVIVLQESERGEALVVHDFT